MWVAEPGWDEEAICMEGRAQNKVFEPKLGEEGIYVGEVVVTEMTDRHT